MWKRARASASPTSSPVGPRAAPRALGVPPRPWARSRAQPRRDAKPATGRADCVERLERASCRGPSAAHGARPRADVRHRNACSDPTDEPRAMRAAVGDGEPRRSARPADHSRRPWCLVATRQRCGGAALQRPSTDCQLPAKVAATSGAPRRSPPSHLQIVGSVLRPPYLAPSACARCRRCNG